MLKGLIVHTVIMDNNGRVLILKRSKNNDVLPGCWDIPGGTLEDGEDPSVGAFREAKEESGLNIATPRPFFQRSNIDREKNKQFITLVFFVKYQGGDIVLNLEEHEELAWVFPKEISDYDTVDYLAECLQALPPIKI
jgi:8-oxo-dGTP diphosphatase